MIGRLIRSLTAPLLSVFLSLMVGSVLVLFSGENPKLLWEALYNVFGTSFGLGFTLFYATPLIFTGLSVALAFHSGLFNIGAEGQLYLGSLSIAVWSYYFPHLPQPLAWIAGFFVCFAVGGCWGGIAGLFKAFRGAHEVIVTILLNFIGLSLADYLILYHYPNPETQNPESFVVSSSYFLPSLHSWISKWGGSLFESTPVNLSFLLAIACALFVYIYLWKTIWGFESRTVGSNPCAARFAGINISKKQVLVFFLAGGLSGMVGLNEVMGHEHKVIQGFSPGYGFTGIAVALLARNHPLAIIFSAVLFGGLHNSARELEFLSDKISKELALVLQSVLIAFIACERLFSYQRQRNG